MVIPVLIKEYPPKMLGKLLFRLLIPALIGFGVILLAKKMPLTDIVEEAYDSFFDRVNRGRDTGEEQSRLTWDLDMFKNNHFESPIFGIGTGSTYQGAQALFGVSPYVSRFGYVESENVKIALEGGLVMVLLRLILVYQLALSFSFKWYYRWILALIMTVMAPIVFNVHNAAFLAMGLMLVDNVIWRQNQAYGQWYRKQILVQPELATA
jgi:hypothetical protein